MGIGSSNNNNKKPDKDTYCIICYENDIQSQRLVCGHAFCFECILSINDYEESPRCPLCRHRICIQTNYPLENGFNLLKIGRLIANCTAIVVSCCLFYYNILPALQGRFRDWDITTLYGLFDWHLSTMHGLFNNVAIQCGRVKDSWF